MAETKNNEYTAKENEAKAMNMETKNQQFEEDVEAILEMLEGGDYFDARNAILKYNEVDSSEILEEILDELGIEKAIIMFRMLP